MYSARVLAFTDQLQFPGIHVQRLTKPPGLRKDNHDQRGIVVPGMVSKDPGHQGEIPLWQPSRLAKVLHTAVKCLPLDSNQVSLSKVDHLLILYHRLQKFTRY